MPVVLEAAQGDMASGLAAVYAIVVTPGHHRLRVRQCLFVKDPWKRC
jgi:hypothetical protein